MTVSILPPAVERFEIHAATCRARAADLRCSTCCDLYERAVAAYAAIAASRKGAA